METIATISALLTILILAVPCIVAWRMIRRP